MTKGSLEKVTDRNPHVGKALHGGRSRMTTFSSTRRKQRAQEAEQTCSVDILPPAKHCISQRFHSVLK